jgi:hypothetical protein
MGRTIVTGVSGVWAAGDPAELIPVLGPEGPDALPPPGDEDTWPAVGDVPPPGAFVKEPEEGVVAEGEGEELPEEGDKEIRDPPRWWFVALMECPWSLSRRNTEASTAARMHAAANTRPVRPLHHQLAGSTPDASDSGPLSRTPAAARLWSSSSSWDEPRAASGEGPGAGSSVGGVEEGDPGSSS